MKNSKIVVVGSANTDMIIKMEKIPVPGETVIGGEFSTAAGGKGANQVVAATRAGGNVTFVAAVGDDLLGSQVIDGLIQDGVNVEYIKRVKDVASGVALIFVDKKGENSIAVASGANAKLSVNDVEKAKGAIQEAKVVLMQLETPLESIRTTAKIAKDSGSTVILNPAPAQKLDNELLSLIDIITPNETEAEILTGIKVVDKESGWEAGKKLIEKGIKTVVITLGSQGALLITKSKIEEIASYPVNAVDTTAAGDTFNGILAVGIAEGKSLVESLELASAGAALSVTKLGAQPSAPFRDEIDPFRRMQVSQVSTI